MMGPTFPYYSHTIILLPQETPNTHVIGLYNNYGTEGHIIGSAEKKKTWILAMFYPMHLFHSLGTRAT